MTDLRDGSVLQDGLRFTPRKPNPGDATRYIPYPVEGQIVNVVAPEGDDNFDQETYLCDIHVTELGIDLFQVPWTLSKAGPDNYVHVGPVAASANLFDPTSGELPKPFNKQLLQPKVSDGDTVVVIFIMGDVHRPKIIAMLPHNQSGPNGMCPDPRPTADDGDCAKVRFGGLSIFLDQDGNLSIYNTQSLDEKMAGQVIPTPKTITIDLTDSLGAHTVTTLEGETGNLTYEGSNGTQVTVDNANDAIDLLCNFGDEISVSAADGIQMSTPASGGTSISMKSGQIDVEAGQGISLTTDGSDLDVISNGGDVNVTSSTGAVSIEADGGDVDIKSTTGGVTIEADGGDVEVKATGGSFKVSDLAGDALELGSGKFKVSNAGGELVDNLEKEVGAFVDNAASAVLTSVGPGQLSPAIVSVLTTVRVFLNTLKA